MTIAWGIVIVIAVIVGLILFVFAFAYAVTPTEKDIERCQEDDFYGKLNDMGEIMNTAWKDRVIEERNELAEKRGKLGLFLCGEAAGLMNKAKYEQLCEQADIMEEYQDILDRRILAFTVKDEKIDIDDYEDEAILKESRAFFDSWVQRLRVTEGISQQWLLVGEAELEKGLAAIENSLP